MRRADRKLTRDEINDAADKYGRGGAIGRGMLAGLLMGSVTGDSALGIGSGIAGYNSRGRDKFSRERERSILDRMDRVESMRIAKRKALRNSRFGDLLDVEE